MRRLPGKLRIAVALAANIHNFDTEKDLFRALGAERGEIELSHNRLSTRQFGSALILLP